MLLHFTEEDQSRMILKVRGLKASHYLEGPEHVGCFNTGLAPICLRRGKVFLVGPQSDVEDAVSVRSDTGLKIRLGEAFSATVPHAGGNTRRTVYIYQRPTAAARKFLGLCDKVLEDNKQTRAERVALQAKAKAGDLGAALTLGLDY